MIVRDVEDRDKAFVEELYVESFPHSERRPVERMWKLYYDNSTSFKISVVEDEGKLVGFITYWDLDGFLYAEHFAISSTLRNGGFGTKVIEWLIDSVDMPIVLEAELPTTILSERRIGFYQRMGFKLWERVQYQQPSYHNDDNTVPMKLMSYGNINVEENLIDIRSKLYSVVYSVGL